MKNQPKMKEILEGLLHFQYPNQRELAATFLRPQEHYESSEFKGKIFTLDEFKKWYVQNYPEAIKAGGKFTYYEDWDGFNIPGHIFNPFFEGKFNPLSKREKNLLGMLEDRKGEKFYTIGTFDNGDPTDVTHEISHGLFYLNPDYKRKAVEIVRNLGVQDNKRLHKYLSDNCYNPEVFDDEMQAYTLASLKYLEEEEGVKITPGMKLASLKLNEIYNKLLKARK